MRQIKLTAPVTEEAIEALQCGDSVLITGEILTGRDAAHKRLCEAMEKGEPLPVTLLGQAIYYAGPCPAKPGEVIGSCGPTTSGRMDKYAPSLLERGLKVMIGKGERSSAVIESMKQNKAVYMAAIGGAGALLAESVQKSEILAYEDLGTEAIRRLTVKDFPCVVVIDCKGNNLYETGRREYEIKQ